MHRLGEETSDTEPWRDLGCLGGLRGRLTRQSFLRGVLALSAAPLLRTIPARADASLAVSEIAPGVFVHQGRYELDTPENYGDIANATFVVGRDAVAVIDTLGSAKAGRELRAALRAVTDKPIRYVINSHMHPDHVLGNAAFKQDDPAFVAHHKMARGLAARAERYMAANKEAMGAEAFEGTEIVLPTVPVETTMTLDLGGRSLILEAQKTAHTDNDLTIRDTETDTLILADLLFSVHVPTLDGSIKGWLALLDSLAQTKAARVVPGHGPHAMELPGALEPEQRYLSTIATEVRKLIKDGKTLEDATRTVGLSERSSWKLFDDFHARNVTAAFAELEWE
jgi:quinoprotein relay system zinc metallohydrolase 2